VKEEFRTIEQRRDAWMREMRYRQRNIVFPETAMNGARYWSNLTSRKYPFTRGQKIAFAFIFLITGTSIFAMLASTFGDVLIHEKHFQEWAPLIPSLGMLVITVILLMRTFLAVFGNQVFPEPTPTSRRNMVIKRSK